jgi:glycosyltransferase involved in cell wall biosynthesis
MVILPTLNERKALARCLTSSSRWGLLLERILAVDGSSTNDTAKEETGAFGVRHPRNMGYGAAVKTLMRAALAADAQYAVLLDADGQHDPTDIPKFLQKLKEGADHAVGNRFPHTKTLPRLQGPSPTPQNTHSKTQRPLQRLPSLQPKSPRNARPRLRPLIRRRDRNKLPTQKS